MSTPTYTTAKKVSDFLVLGEDTPREVEVNIDSAQAEVNMGSRVVYFSAGDEVLVYDDDTPIGEEMTIDSITGTTLTMTSNFSNSYTTVKNAKCQCLSYFTRRSQPKRAVIDNLICVKEDVLDRDIHTSYKNDGELIEEYVTFMLGSNNSFPYFSQPLRYDSDSDFPIKVDNQALLPFDPSKGDFLFANIGGEWIDILDPSNGYKIWESVIDDIVDSEDLSAGSPITCTLEMQPRLATRLHWKLTHANITEFSLEMVGTDQDGTAVTETVTEADGWEGYTEEFFQTVTSITFTRTVGLGTGDTLDVDTQKEKSRVSQDYDLWADYDHGVFYPKTIAIETGHKTVRAGYRRGHYRQAGSRIPGDIEEICTKLVAIELLLNERYALNLPKGGQVNMGEIHKTIQVWRSDIKKLTARRREIVGGLGYQ